MKCGTKTRPYQFDTLGVALSLLFDFVTYVCSSLLVLLNVRERRKRKTAAASEHTPRQDESARVKTDDEYDDDGDVLSGLRFVWGIGIIRSIAFSAGQFNFFTAVFFTIYYVFVVRVLHMDPVAVGLAATCSGIGGIVSSVAVGPSSGAWRPAPCSSPRCSRPLWRRCSCRCRPSQSSTATPW